AFGETDASLECFLVEFGFREADGAEDAAAADARGVPRGDALDEVTAEVLAGQRGGVDFLPDLREAVREVAADGLDEVPDRADGLTQCGPADGGGDACGGADDEIEHGFALVGGVLERGSERAYSA